MTPEVLVFITCRNYENYLSEAVVSAHMQTVPCMVYVSHDDCGGYHPVGLSANRNKLLGDLLPLALAFDYVIFMDADDMLPNNYVAEHLRIAAEYPDHVICCPAEMWGDQTGIIDPLVPTNVEKLICGNTIHCSALIPIKHLLSFGGYDETLTAFEDWEMWTKLASHGVQFDRTTYTHLLYRRHAGSMNRTLGDTVETVREKLIAKYGKATT